MKEALLKIGTTTNPAKGASVTALDYSPALSLLVAGLSNGVLQLWKKNAVRNTFVLLQQSRPLKKTVNAVQCHPTKPWVAVATESAEVAVYSVAHLTVSIVSEPLSPLKSTTAPLSVVSAMCWLGTSGLLLCGSPRGVLAVLFDDGVNDPFQLQAVEGHVDCVQVVLRGRPSAETRLSSRLTPLLALRTADRRPTKLAALLKKQQLHILLLTANGFFVFKDFDLVHNFGKLFPQKDHFFSEFDKVANTRFAVFPSSPFVSVPNTFQRFDFRAAPPFAAVAKSEKWIRREFGLFSATVLNFRTGELMCHSGAHRSPVRLSKVCPARLNKGTLGVAVILWANVSADNTLSVFCSTEKAPLFVLERFWREKIVDFVWTDEGLLLANSLGQLIVVAFAKEAFGLQESGRHKREETVEPTPCTTHKQPTKETNFSVSNKNLVVETEKENKPKLNETKEKKKKTKFVVCGLSSSSLSRFVVGLAVSPEFFLEAVRTPNGFVLKQLAVSSAGVFLHSISLESSVPLAALLLSSTLLVLCWKDGSCEVRHAALGLALFRGSFSQPVCAASLYTNGAVCQLLVVHKNCFAEFALVEKGLLVELHFLRQVALETGHRVEKLSADQYVVNTGDVFVLLRCKQKHKKGKRARLDMRAAVFRHVGPSAGLFLGTYTYGDLLVAVEKKGNKGLSSRKKEFLDVEHVLGYVFHDSVVLGQTSQVQAFRRILTRLENKTGFVSELKSLYERQLDSLARPESWV